MNKNYKNPTLKKYSKYDFIYEANHSFYKHYRDNKTFDNASFKSKHSFPANFFDHLDKYHKVKTKTGKTEKKKCVKYSIRII